MAHAGLAFRNELNENNYRFKEILIHPTFPTMMLRTLALAALLLPVAISATEIPVTLKDHKFSPAEVRVPAGQKVKLVVENLDPTPEEFESKELNREKIIAPRSKAAIWIGPLQPGRYPFFGEFNPATAQGVVIVE